MRALLERLRGPFQWLKDAERSGYVDRLDLLGSNENTNRLLRQYLAKGAGLRTFSMRDLNDIAKRINTRPRRVLDWATAAELFWPQVRAEGVS